jgi:hypothetical protein
MINTADQSSAEGAKKTNVVVSPDFRLNTGQRCGDEGEVITCQEVRGKVVHDIERIQGV